MDISSAAYDSISPTDLDNFTNQLRPLAFPLDSEVSFVPEEFGAREEAA